MIKARVKVDLNERTQEPSVNAPINAYYKKGQEIAIVEIINGQENKGNNVWYKLDNGSFVWSGGVEGLTSIEVKEPNKSITKPTNSPPRPYDYNAKDVAGLPSTWRTAVASNINIGVIDSGCISHTDLAVSQRHTVDGLGVDDMIGHGTHLAGLIGGQNTSTIRGVSPASKIHTINTYHPSVGIVPGNATAALQQAISLNCDIINLSLQIFQENDAALNAELTNAHNSHILIVAAAGEDDELFNNVYFPAKWPNVIAIGSFNSGFVSSIRTLKNTLIDLVLPNHKLWSTDIAANNFYKDRSGSSMATAVATGIVSQLITANGIAKDANRLDHVRSLLNTNFEHISKSNYTDYRPYKVKS